MEVPNDYNSITSFINLDEPTSVTDIFLKVLFKHINVWDVQSLHVDRSEFDNTYMSGHDQMGEEGIDIVVDIKTTYFELSLQHRNNDLTLRFNQFISGRTQEVIVKVFHVYQDGQETDMTRCNDPYVQIDKYVSEVLDEFNSQLPK